MAWGRGPVRWKRNPAADEDGDQIAHKFKAKACYVMRDLTLIEERGATPEVLAWVQRERKADKKDTYGCCRFTSKREAKRWIELRQKMNAGLIRDLRRQVPFSLQARRPDGLMEHVSKYIADFVYFSLETQREHVEDSKGFRDAKYELKKKWFEIQFGRQIEEV